VHRDAVASAEFARGVVFDDCDDFMTQNERLPERKGTDLAFAVVVQV
jgi:hypothetical protein